jgi:hypothetical protein
VQLFTRAEMIQDMVPRSQNTKESQDLGSGPVTARSNTALPDTSTVARVCESFILNGLHNLAGIQKSIAALHGTVCANPDVATFRSGVRFTQSIPAGCEKLALAAETLRSEATELGLATVSDFDRKQHAQLIKLIAAFEADLSASEHGSNKACKKVHSRLQSRSEEALAYVQSRSSGIVKSYWPELINQLLEDTALLLHAHQTIAVGQTITVDPHGRFIEPIELVNLQATVDHEIHTRSLILARCRAACARFADLAEECNGHVPVSIELLREVRASFSVFYNTLERGTNAHTSHLANSSTGPLGSSPFLSQAHAALLESCLVRPEGAAQAHSIILLVSRLCEQELTWVEYSSPFHSGQYSRTFRDNAARLKHPPRDLAAPSRTTWERSGLRRTTTIPRSQRRIGDEPLSSGEKHALRNWESLLRYGIKANNARLDARPRGACPNYMAQYGGSAGIMPSPRRLSEYVEFQKQFSTDPTIQEQRCGLGGYLSEEWLETALRLNELSIIEKRCNGKLLGIYFLATDERRLTPLGQAVTNWIDENAASAAEEVEGQMKAFTEIVVGPSDRENYNEYGQWTATALHEFAEATASFESGGHNLALYGVCRTKPKNIAISSHQKHGWIVTGLCYTTDDGREYVVLRKLIPQIPGYHVNGSLREMRLPMLGSVTGEMPFDAITAAHNLQAVTAAQYAARQQEAQNRLPSLRQSTYRDVVHLYEQLLCSSLSRESDIRAWEVHAPETIAQELIRFVFGSQSPKRAAIQLERALANSPLEKLFASVAPERHRRACLDLEILRVAASCERLASRAQHMGAQKQWQWLYDSNYIEKPRLVARILRDFLRST